ncbi:MAG: hypothetical protein ABSE18_03340 [Minisyncoccia bacterium]|jgi:phosphoribosylaminoimidazolecarboxamide formyltransferase/IMP cyclohydrolase
MTALLSVYHKEGIVEFARDLVARGWKILASGGTAKALREGGITVRDVSDIVGEPILGHRVVTLSRQIHAGLLARSIPEDEEELKRLGLPRIDLVCVDLYPLHDAIEKEGSTRASVIEMTDVGGPTMLHSAAKGERIVISDPADRAKVIEWIDKGYPDREKFIDYLDAKADAIVAEYCLTASRYRSGGQFDGLIGSRILTCKYGENAWQTPAALYATEGTAGSVDTAGTAGTAQDAAGDPLALFRFRTVAGDAPSYNNLCDVDRMLQTATHIAAVFDVNRKKVPHIAVGVKHGNPCGAAVGSDPIGVVENMLAGDLRAIFGGLVMTTFPVDAAVAETLMHAQMPEGARRLLDGVVAPSFTPEAVEILARKGGKCRLLENAALRNLTAKSLNREIRFRAVRGGFLTQPNYTFVLDLKNPRVERSGNCTPEQENDLLLAWAIGSTSNSNTVTLVAGSQLIGNGVGQQDRVSCCELAIKRAKDAGHEVAGAVAASDSFFPFPDGPEVLAKAGIKAILATSGSVKDSDVKAMCAKYGVPLIMVPDAAARGFYQH